MLSPLRLSFVCHEFPPLGGGASSALDRFTRVLASRGHRIQILTVGAGRGVEITEAEGRRLVRLGAGRRTPLSPSLPELIRSYFALRWRSQTLLQDFATDLVVSYFAFPAGHALLPVCQRLKIPLVVSLRGSDVPGFHSRRWGGFAPLLTRLVRPVLQQADGVISNGEHLRHLALKLQPDLSVTSLPNGIDTRPFAPVPPFPSPRPPKVLFVGQFIPRKRPLELLDGLAGLAARGISVHATLVGDGPLGEAIRTRVAALPQTVRVHLPGFQPRAAMAGIYREHDVLVHLSHAEGVSNVLLEAMASGLAVIATPEACDGALSEGGGVRLVEHPTPMAITDALAELLQDGEKRTAMRQAALATVTDWDWNRVAVAFEGYVAERFAR